MQKILTDLELDIKEIKYLLNTHRDEADAVLMAKRRIRMMQAHLVQLLSEIETEEVKEENYMEKEESETEEMTVEEEEEKLEEEEEELGEIEIDEDEEEEEDDDNEDDDEYEDNETDENEPQPFNFTVKTVLGENLKPSTNLIKSISLNDSFRFSREVFDGDTLRMNNFLQQISVMDNFGNVMVLLRATVQLDDENETHTDFIDLLKKHFA